MKIAVITANIGGIDTFHSIPEQTVYFEQHYFTAAPEGITGNDRMKALYYKCNMYQLVLEVDVFIWLDGKVKVVVNDFVEKIIAALGNGDIAALKHHERNCIYQEVDHIEHCMRKGNQYLLARYKDKPLRRQVEAYRYYGYPANNGLNDCCIIAMKNNNAAAGVSNGWWHDVYNCNGFDQIALQFHAWARGIKIKSINFSREREFLDIPHDVLK